MEERRAVGERRAEKRTQKNNQNLIQADASVPLHMRSCVRRFKTRLAALHACSQAGGPSGAGKGNLGSRGEVSG